MLYDENGNPVTAQMLQAMMGQTGGMGQVQMNQDLGMMGKAPPPPIPRSMYGGEGSASIYESLAGTGPSGGTFAPQTFKGPNQFAPLEIPGSPNAPGEQNPYWRQTGRATPPVTFSDGTIDQGSGRNELGTTVSQITAPATATSRGAAPGTAGAVNVNEAAVTQGGGADPGLASKIGAAAGPLGSGLTAAGAIPGLQALGAVGLGVQGVGLLATALSSTKDPYAKEVKKARKLARTQAAQSLGRSGVKSASTEAAIVGHATQGMMDDSARRTKALKKEKWGSVGRQAGSMLANYGMYKYGPQLAEQRRRMLGGGAYYPGAYGAFLWHYYY